MTQDITHQLYFIFCGVTRLRKKTEEELPINQNQLNSDTHKDESAEEKDVFSKTSNLLDSQTEEYKTAASGRVWRFPYMVWFA